MAETNYNLCIKKAYPGITNDDFSLEQDEIGLRLIWLNAATYGTAPTLISLETQWLALVKEQALIDIKTLRQQGLDKAALSSGVLAVYNTNYEAATNFLAGNGSLLVKNGMTSIDYLSGFGANLGMTATQFANYIVSENYRVGPTAYSIEKRYLALTYAGDLSEGVYPVSILTTVDAVVAAVDAYRIFCGVPSFSSLVLNQSLGLTVEAQI
jgi:hypothetical protein